MLSPIIIPTTEPFFFPGGATGCLMVHGFTGTPKEMRWLGEHLAGKGHSVLGVRLAAHATRPDDMIRARWHDWLASVEDGWHLLSGCCERIYIIGLSMGGILSLLFAAGHPVAGVVALAAPHHLPADPRLRFIKPISLFKPFFAKGEPDWFDWDAYAEHISYDRDPTRAYAEVRGLIEEMQSALPVIRAPALLVYSKDDQTVRAEDGHMQAIYDALGSREKERLWIEGSGHVITRDAQRQTVFQAVAGFIDRQEQK